MLIVEVESSNLRGRASCGCNISSGTNHFIIATKGNLYSKCKSCVPKGRVSRKLKAREVVEFR